MFHNDYYLEMYIWDDMFVYWSRLQDENFYSEYYICGCVAVLT